MLRRGARARAAAANVFEVGCLDGCGPSESAKQIRSNSRQFEGGWVDGWRDATECLQVN